MDKRRIIDCSIKDAGGNTIGFFIEQPVHTAAIIDTNGCSHFNPAIDQNSSQLAPRICLY